jgi:acetate---CoA ligase (ADP-forming)
MSIRVGYVANRHQLYGRQELHRLINPRSVAVIGASETRGSFGARSLENINIGFTGKVFPVNPRYQSIGGIPCYAALEDLPEVPDCVIVIVPMSNVEDLVNRAAAMGVGGMVIYSAGFAEMGTPELVDTQHRLALAAQKSGMRILGPNCIGIVNLTSPIGLTFMPQFAELARIQGPIGLISQSGALGYNLLQGLQRGIGFSHYLSSGNSCDVDVGDLINYLVEDDSTKVICCIFEGIRDGGRLVEACRRALKANKPLLIYKIATSSISQQASLSHTGTIAGSSAAYTAAFARTGVIEISDYEDILETALLFSKAGIASAQGIGIMASSGGAAVMAADKAELQNLPVPPPAPQTAARMAKLVPDFGSTANPCDLTAESLKSVQMYGDCIRAFADDPGFAAIVVPMMSAYAPTTIERAQYLSTLASELTKPICLVWLTEWLTGPGSEVYDSSPRIAMFRSMTRCMKALRWWLQYHRQRATLLQPYTRELSTIRIDTVRSLLHAAKQHRTLSESESKQILKSYEVPVTEEEITTSPDAAAKAARRIGFPVVMKVDSADIPHKTEAGVIRLNVKDEAAARDLFAELMNIAGALPNKPEINGVLVQKMMPKGVEMMIGARRDLQFGPLIMCGFGGIEVELTRDVAVALAPVSRDQAKEMILSLKRAPLLQGFRKLPPADIDALADAVCRVSELASDLQDEIAEIDVNPFILGTTGGVAVDALIVRPPIDTHTPASSLST